MNIQSVNKALASQCVKALNFAFTSGFDASDMETYFCHDTDNVDYETIASKEKVTLYFKCPDLEKIYNYGHKHMIERYYKSNN